MTDIPVIMSKPMVLATLRETAAPGTGKTETRRGAWLPSKRPIGVLTDAKDRSEKATIWQSVKPGDRLWVKEGIRISQEHANFYYEADDKGVGEEVWRRLSQRAFDRGKPYVNLSGRYIPKFASRITLVVTAAKMQRLWDISEKSCEAEGVIFETADPPFWYVPGLDHAITGVGVEERADLMPHPVQCFRKLWIHLHGREAWDANPEVVAVSFEPFLCNIDAMPRKPVIAPDHLMAG
jgi:hypothetical protein